MTNTIPPTARSKTEAATRTIFQVAMASEDAVPTVSAGGMAADVWFALVGALMVFVAATPEDGSSDAVFVEG
jgi:hypothetical protein